MKINLYKGHGEFFWDISLNSIYVWCFFSIQEVILYSYMAIERKLGWLLSTVIWNWEFYLETEKVIQDRFWNFLRTVDVRKMCDSFQNIGNIFWLTFIIRTNCKNVLFWKSEIGYFQIKILQNSSAWYISKKGKIAFSKSTKAYKVPDP